MSEQKRLSDEELQDRDPGTCDCYDRQGEPCHWCRQVEIINEALARGRELAQARRERDSLRLQSEGRLETIRALEHALLETERTLLPCRELDELRERVRVLEADSVKAIWEVWRFDSAEDFAEWVQRIREAGIDWLADALAASEEKP